MLCADGLIVPEHRPSHIIHAGNEPAALLADTSRTLAEIERAYIKAVLDSTRGNQTQAAKILGVSSSTLWRKLKSGKQSPSGF